METRITEIKLRLKEIEAEKEILLKESNLVSHSAAVSSPPAKCSLFKVTTPKFRSHPSGLSRNLLGQLENLSQKEKSTELTPNEKIKLFRSLFKTRDDVYARKWKNKEKIGYSPVKTYTGDYLPLTDEVIKYHLQGINPKEPLHYGQKRDFIVGVYPLLKNENCNFLAVDFDAKHTNSDWKAEVKAFIDTCKTLNINAYIEISRSGMGAHIWIFFENEISSVKARKLGSLILTLAMENNPNISFKTYDRFFPNQDTMPKGGLGNLIALPLQKRAREENKTVFVNENFVPYQDQWLFLLSVKKVPEVQINSILKTYRELELKNNFYDENDTEPWKLPNKDDFTNIKLPENIKIILANKIYIEKENLPPKLINKFLKMAAFQNPEFYRTQAMRFSTYDKPRIIACGDILPKHIAIPRGCLDELSAFCEKNKITIELQDKRLKGKKIKASFQGKLKDEQSKAYKELIEKDFGILSAPTAFGKTVLASKIISKRKVSTLILVHRKQLAAQWKQKLKEFLNIEAGIIGGGKNKPAGIIDIAIMQSLIKQENSAEFLSNYAQLIVDECHHLAAYKFDKLQKSLEENMF